MKRILFIILIIPTLTFAYIKPFIGVSVKEMPDSLKGLYGKRILVDNVIENSPASHFGIKKGDIIISIDNTDIFSLSKLQEVIGKCKPYQRIKIGLIHNKKKNFVILTLGGKDEKIYLGAIILKNKNTLLINDIVKDSPAEKGGLQIGDEIISIDNKKLIDPKQISQILDKKGYDNSILIKIKRENKVIKKRILLFPCNLNLLRKSYSKKDKEFINDMKRIFFILNEK